MTTNRTSISRRLAIRRRPHGPPAGVWKSGHGVIVPSLIATVATAVAVGAGVAFARAERERRRGRGRRLGLQPQEPLGEGLRRTALGQLDLAIRLLESPAHVDAEAVHGTRKAIKRLRALLRMLQGELGQTVYDRENAALRRVARSLAAARDAEVMLDTLDQLVARHPGKLGGRGGVIRLRAQLLTERDTLRARDLDPATIARALIELRACRTRVAAWSLPERPGLALVEPGLLRIYRQGRRRFARVKRGKGDQVLAMHQWRRRVKDLRYAAEMLERQAALQPAFPPRPTGKHARRPKRGRLRRVARRADSLGELLGEDHDLAVLDARVRTKDDRSATGPTLSRRTRKRLSKLIARRRRELRRRALREGKRLFARRPARFVRRIRETYARGRRR
jgi:CHAD domain-containing protein